MKINKLSVLGAIFTYFGRCSVTTRLRWGRILGWLTPKLVRSRAHIVRTNLALCFPELPEQKREALLRRHFYLLAQSVVDRGLMWFGRPECIAQTVSMSGLHHFDALMAEQRRVIFLVPHFIGLDASATRLAMHSKKTASLYTPQSDPEVDLLVRQGRTRFNEVVLVSRHDGVRGLIRQLRGGTPIYYLPDMDFGLSGAAFVPFFNVPAATLLTTAQIAKSWDAAVIPVISRLDLETGHYQAELLPPLENFPGEQSAEEATARLNELIQTWIMRDPAQYYWVHRRFKTRPNGEPKPY